MCMVIVPQVQLERKLWFRERKGLGTRLMVIVQLHVFPRAETCNCTWGTIPYTLEAHVTGNLLQVTCNH